VLRVENIFAGYGKKEVLKNVVSSFEKGKVTAVLGANGSGKSTLLKVLDKILKPFKGTVYINGRELKDFSRKELAKYVAYLPQRTDFVPYFSVFEVILLGRKPYISFEPTEEDLLIVEKLIKDFGLEPFAFRKILELSGGELQKVLIARAMAQKPQILLLDEPVNHLDPKNQIEILGILKRLTQDMALVNITVLHDLNLALRFSDYFVFMKDGRIYSEGDVNIVTESLIKEIFDIHVELVEIKGKKIMVMA